jgi:hypothetical protein
MPTELGWIRFKTVFEEEFGAAYVACPIVNADL